MSFIQNFFTSRDNNSNSATYVGQQDRLWWDPVTNRIYYSDGVTPGGIPVGGGGNANLGNWAFDGNTQYNINGGRIDNSDLMHGPTAWLQIPENGSANNIGLLNYYGNVSITAATDPGNTRAWTFDSAGNLTLPTNSASINYANGTPYGGSGNATNITVQNQGNTLTTAANTINFTGNAVSSTNVGNVVTVNINASGGYIPGVFGLIIDGGTAPYASPDFIIDGGLAA